MTSLNHKLTQACAGLGISLLEVSRLVQVSDLPNVACWGYDTRTKQDYIFVNPRVLRFKVEQIRLILTHEMLHYAGYQQISGAKDQDLANIALDIAVNKVLALAHEPEMKSLCRRIYPQETTDGIVALARPDLTPSQIDDPDIRTLWQQIWEEDEIPSPASLYYKLQFSAEPVDLIVWPFWGTGDGDIVLRAGAGNGEGDQLAAAAKGTIEKLIAEAPFGGGFSQQVSELFSPILVGKQVCDTAQVTDLLRRISVRQQVEQGAARIIRALDGSSGPQLYPYNLSRLGLIYMACGVSGTVPLYWNKQPVQSKPRLAIYLDTSPSMEPFQEMEVFLVDELRDHFPAQAFAFAGSVKEISLQQFADGNYEAGHSTSFDAVIEHLLGSDYEAGVVFTDGYSSVSSCNQQHIRQNGKRLFVVYFTSHHSQPTSDLDQVAEATAVIRQSR